ncbi:MAG: DctP [Rhodospirillales bacterium]|nr:DctP [Rhodospirillales bacterium]
MLVRTISGAIAGLLLLSGSASAEPAKVKFGWFAPDTDTSYSRVLKPWADSVNAEAKGVLQIDTFTNGALGRNLAQQPDLILQGVEDIGFIVPGLSSGRFPDTEVLTLPGLFRDLKEATTVYTRFVESGRIADYKDFYPIGMMATPPFTVHARSQIKTIDDMKGKMLRTGGAIESSAVKQLGGVPVLIPVNEITEAISRGTVEGTTAQPATLFDFGMQRVTKYDYFMPLGTAMLTLVMNKKVYDGLSVPARQAIDKYSGKWFADKYNVELTAYTAELIDRLKTDKKRVVTFPSQAELDTAADAFKPLLEEWAGRSEHNRDLLRDVQAEIVKIRSGQ